MGIGHVISLTPFLYLRAIDGFFRFKKVFSADFGRSATFSSPLFQKMPQDKS